MKQAVSRTRESLSERIDDIVSFGKEIDRATLDDLEAALIAADLGTATTHEVLEKLRQQADRKQIADVAELKRLLRQELLAILTAAERPPQKVEPPEVLLVVGATTGQNGLQQARLFTQSAGVTGIVLTKLDGTAKGGVVVAISRELGLPVRYAGTGEKVDDLLPFNPQDFVASLLE